VSFEEQGTSIFSSGNSSLFGTPAPGDPEAGQEGEPQLDADGNPIAPPLPEQAEDAEVDY
jgi:hypothetical protein